MPADIPNRTIKHRLSPAERERQIVSGAIAFFAEVGLDGQTRELANRLGITQPLLYRYFPSKELLLERVYEEVYDKRWKPEWEALIADRSLSIGERFRRFEKDYQRTIMTYDWLRIFFSAGLKGTDLPARYLSRVRSLIFTPVLAELRRELGLPSPEVLPLSAQEFELIFGIHGALLYVGIRKFIYNMDVSTDQELVFDAEIDAFLAGVGPVMRRLIAEQQARARIDPKKT
ncbi:MAG: TetR/AcrR family transcriptional regulator [Beijerinckiaceae bacterium]